jgi:hypothetical protein
VTSLTGQVVSRGAPAADATIVVFADDPARWTFPSRYVRTTRSDKQGAFTLRALPPAEYLVAALGYLEQGEAQDPEFLERLRARATRVRIDDGDRASVDLVQIGR